MNWFGYLLGIRKYPSCTPLHASTLAAQLVTCTLTCGTPICSSVHPTNWSPSTLLSLRCRAVPFGAAPDPVHAHARTIVDLSPDFRDPDIACSAGYVIGLPELYRDTINGATRISVPGCMATAATLALRPLVVSGFVQGDVIVDARTGSSGAGSMPSEASHHAERQNAFRVYSPAGHRHEPEIAQMCGVRARMTVTAVPTVRGVQAVLHVRTPRPVTRDQVWSAYRDVYTSEPFVRIVAQRSGGTSTATRSS